MTREIRNALFFLLGLLLGGMVASAHAAAPTWSAWTPDDPDSHCPAEFAASGASQYGWIYYGYNLSYTSTGQRANCKAYCNSQSLCGAQYQTVGGVGVPANRTATCASGTYDGNGSCSDPCEVGAASSATWWNGCFDVDGVDNGCDAGARLPYPTGGVCNGTCVVSISTWTSCSFPVGGGPITCSGNGTLTGSTCQPGDNYIPSSATKCPDGYAIGTVNGVPGCYKTGSDPSPLTTTTQSTDPQTGVVTTTTTTNNTTTNTTTTTTTTYNPTTNTTTTQTVKTPTNPANPMTESKAPGENQEPFEIDETGTPTDGSLSQAKSEFETAANAHKTFLDGLANQGSHGLTWDWGFELPSGTCSAYGFTIAGRNFTLDPCEKLGMVRDMLGFLIYITTALALLAIATGYGKEGK